MGVREWVEHGGEGVGGALDEGVERGVRRVEHWMRGWRARVGRGVRRVEHWMRGWRARVGRGVRRVEHWRG